MLRILTCQVIAAVLGTVSISAADWLYHRGSIRQRLHDFWVSASSTAICLPLLIWTASVFLGFGAFSEMLIASIAAIMFLWIYFNLRKVPSEQRPEWGQRGRQPSVRPMSSNVSCFDPICDINQISKQIAPHAETRHVEEMLPR